MITIQPGKRRERYNSWEKKQAKCEIQETYSPSIAFGCQTFVKETNALARKSLAS